VASVLLTGGTGYIGSHTSIELMRAGYDTILYDNLCNSSPVVVDRIEQITGKRPEFIQGDIRDRAALECLFETHTIDAVVHLAGLKAVAESVQRPLDYYISNVCGSTTLFDAMRSFDIRRIVFSSSATVYDPKAQMPLKESSAVGPANPYGRSKLMIEQILCDIAAADPSWRVLCLRYFNPVGAHASGLIGEDPRGEPNNLMPYVAQVAVGRRSRLRIFGDDYPTPDGTGVLDYIHVVDLATGHVAALERLMEDRVDEERIVNLGSGRGHSVLELVRAFTRATGVAVPYEVTERRAGDVAVSLADPALSLRYLGWQANRDLDAMCADTWRWQVANASGYGDPAVRST
jgi:UDP-glucose 4-epimerase